MKSLKKISDAEWMVMHALWKNGRQSSNEVVAEIVPKTGWSPNTVRTLLNRLTDKGVLLAEKERGKEKDYPLCFYTPLHTREECEAIHTRTFLDKVFDGDAYRLLAHFVDEMSLTPEQIEELRKKLDEIQ